MPPSLFPPVVYSKLGPTREDYSPSEEEFTEEGLTHNPKWLNHARTVYKSEHDGEDWKKSNKKLGEWFKNRHSEIGNDLTSMGWLAYKADDFDYATKKAWVESMDMYENLDVDLQTVRRAIKNTIQDPSFLIPTLATAGFAGVARLVGGKGAQFVGRLAFKEQLKRALAKEGVSKKGLKEFVEKGVSKEIDVPLLKRARQKARRKWGAGQAASFGGWGAAHGGLESIEKQQFEDVYETPSEHIDVGEVAKNAALGFGLGALFAGPGVVFNKAREFGAKSVLGKYQGKLDALQKQAEGRAQRKDKLVVKPFSPTLTRDEIGNILNDAGNQLNLGGTLHVKLIGGVQQVKNQRVKDLKEEALKKAQTEGSLTPDATVKNLDKETLAQIQKDATEQSQKIYKEAEEAVVEEAANIGIDLAPITRTVPAPGFTKTGEVIVKPSHRFKGKRISPIDEIEEEVSTIADGRSWITQFLAKIDRKVGLTRSPYLTDAQRLLTGGLGTITKRAKGRIDLFNRAVAKDFGGKYFADLPKETGKVLNKILEGQKLEPVEEALLPKGGAPETIKQLGLMRQDIEAGQKNMLNSGMLEPGENLYGKIEASMDGKDVELWLNKQYRAYNDPEWSNIVTNDKTVMRNVRQYLKGQARNTDKTFKEIDNKKVLALHQKRQAGEDMKGLTGLEDLDLDQIDYWHAVAGEEGSINQTIRDILSVNNPEDLFRVFETPINVSRGKSFKILAPRQVIPNQIKALLGEYDDPITNYANSLIKILTTTELYKYEKSIADVIKGIAPLGSIGSTLAAPTKWSKFLDKLPGAVPASVLGVEPGKMTQNLLDEVPISRKLLPMEDRPESLIPGTATRPDAEKGIVQRIPSILSSEKVDQPFRFKEEFKGTAGYYKSPLEGMFATPEIADAILKGNEIAVVNFKPLQQFLILQGLTRSAVTVWSPTAAGRNFLGAAWNSFSAGYLDPRELKSIREVWKGMIRENDAVLEAAMIKEQHLGIAQSGIETGAYREALRLGSRKEFYDLRMPFYTHKEKLVDKADKINTPVLKFYQAMDDMWKRNAMEHERRTGRRILEDFGVNPDEVLEEFVSPKGIPIKITRLDKYAAQNVADYMQNYAGVPQFVRYARLAPMADFLAFTTEQARIQANLLIGSLKAIDVGSRLMKGTNSDRGKALRNQGYKRLGTMIAAHGAAPALATTSAIVGQKFFGQEDLSETLPGQNYTKKEGIEFFNAPWDKGSTFMYFGGPKDGEGTRLNLSYINPYAKFEDPLRAGWEAYTRNENVEDRVMEAMKETFWEPLKETLGPSMLTDGLVNIMYNRDKYGSPLYKGSESLGKQMTTGVLTFLESFEPGFVTSAKKIYESIAQKPVGKADAIMKGKSGRKLTKTWHQVMGLSGVKPQRYDLKIDLRNKIWEVKDKMGEAGKIWTDIIREQSPTTKTELIRAYDNSLSNQYAYAKELYDIISHAKSAGMSEEDIFQTITYGGMFSKYLDKRVIQSIIKDGVFIPPQPLKKDVLKWNQVIKNMGGSPPPIEESQEDLFNIYSSFAGASLGERGEEQKFPPVVYSQLR